MRKTVCGLMLASAIAWSFAACELAFGEQIPLRDGVINVQSVMAGESEVTLEGRDFEFDGYARGLLGAMGCVTPCDPGDIIDLGAYLYEFFGAAVFQDENYNVGTWDGDEYITIDIEGSMRVPRHREGQETKTASARVKINGDFYHGQAEEELSGYARATVVFTWNDLGWMVKSLNYDIRRR